jgi:nucleoid DNA-binding protein
MIKVDIVNEVSKLAEITKVKAEAAVDAVFDAMRCRCSVATGSSSRVRRIPGEATQARHRP